MSAIWVRAALSVGAVALFSLILWPLAGPSWALLALAGGLAGLLARQFYFLEALRRWAREPIGTPVPRGDGAWSYAFSALNRRARQALDQRLRLSSALARFREASGAMPDGVMILSGANEIEWLNPAAAEHFGLDARRDIASPLSNLVRQPDFVGYIEGEQYAAPLKLRLSRNPARTLSIQVIPFGEDHRLLLSRDITRFERMETMRRDFVANVSHELRTPLTVVNGFLEMLQDFGPELAPEEHARYVALSREQVDRMRRLVEDLLVLSSLETDHPAPVEERLPVAALLQSVRAEAEGLSAGRHRIQVVQEGGACLLGSQRELHSAVGNLAINAVRYTPPGGVITLRWAMNRDGGGALGVEDTGIGIEAKHIPRLTERFYRVDKGRSREAGGTGLGLAIVKHVLERHQARLEIKSTPGQGSRFTIHFPARRVAAGEAAAPPQARPLRALQS